MIIEFKDPPEPQRGRGRHPETRAILTALQSRPGEWALIKGLEVKTSSLGKPRGRVDVYARWVGDAA